MSSNQLKVLIFQHENILVKENIYLPDDHGSRCKSKLKVALYVCMCVYYIFTNIEIERNGEHILNHFFLFCKPYNNQSRQDSRQAYSNFTLQVKMTSPEVALNPWSAKFTKWSNTFKQFVGKKRVKPKKNGFCSISMKVITTRLFRIVDQMH